MPKNLSTIITTLFFIALIIPGCGGSKATPPPETTEAIIPPEITLLRKIAKPFNNTDPNSNLDDIFFIGDMIQDASIVALGEATHGSSEFQKMKDKIFRYLVLHKGVTGFGLEAQMGRCYAINQYILTGQGDPKKLIDGQGFWVWSTEEMLELVQWMRRYNSTHDKKVQFFGFDVQDGGYEMNHVISFLQSVDPNAAEKIASLYDPFKPYTFFNSYKYVSAENALRLQCKKNIAEAYQWLLDHRIPYTAASSSEAFAWALRMARVVVLNESLAASNPINAEGANVRDAGMAENASWFLETMGPDTKIVLSGHNNHINKMVNDADYIPLGQVLFEKHKSRYKSMGFAFDSGSFYAYYMSNSGNFGSLRVCTAPPMTGDFYEYTFAKADLNLAIIDFSTLSGNPPGAAWFFWPHYFREIGSAWNASYDTPIDKTALTQRFDQIIFIKNVTATKLLK